MASRPSLLRQALVAGPSTPRRAFALSRPAAAADVSSSADEGSNSLDYAADAGADSSLRTWLDVKNEQLLQWFKGEGEKWKWPSPRKHNWIGGDRPFTANPYFTPTPPLSADLQDEMYSVYVSFPAGVTAVERVHLISERYGIGKDRVTAIVKTGQVADTWKEVGLAPQNAFVRGMEDFLVVPKHTAGSSEALQAFPTYIGSRIDLERDVESARLARGEISSRAEDQGFHIEGQTQRLGLMSWEFAKEGEIPLSMKMQLEKPLRPPPALPLYPSRLVVTPADPGAIPRTGAAAAPVKNVVDVGDKFRGQGWDGKLLTRSGNRAPGRQNAMRKFAPLLARQAREAAAGPEAETKEMRRQRAKAEKAALNAQGKLTPTQEVIAKATLAHREDIIRRGETPPPLPESNIVPALGGIYDPAYKHKALIHANHVRNRLDKRERRREKKAITRRENIASQKAELLQMIKDRISGKI